VLARCGKADLPHNGAIALCAAFANWREPRYVRNDTSFGPANRYSRLNKKMFRVGGFDGTDFEQQCFQHPLHAVIFHELRSRDDAFRVKARACDGPCAWRRFGKQSYDRRAVLCWLAVARIWDFSCAKDLKLHIRSIGQQISYFRRNRLHLISQNITWPFRPQRRALLLAYSSPNITPRV
jgi:hypothetical protein